MHQGKKFNFYFSGVFLLLLTKLQLVHTMFITNNHAVLLMVNGNLVKYEKVSKYYDHDCRGFTCVLYCVFFKILNKISMGVFNFSEVQTMSYLAGAFKVFSFCFPKKIFLALCEKILCLQKNTSFLIGNLLSSKFWPRQKLNFKR